MNIVSRPPSDPAPRIGALSVLPVFLDLTGKCAVVAGGSEAAAWKVELLVSAGANVDLYAGELSEGMEELAVRHPAIHHFPRSWRAGDLNGATVALCDAEHDVEAVAFEQAAREAGVPCNIIDRPDYCHFQFGTIVNRSPVVVGISTSGAAPVLGQAIRRRIETLLPATLADWAQLARQWRDRVAAALPAGQARRRFWERFVDHAFGPAPEESSAISLLHGLNDVEGCGHVTFVGAGPGDAELITLKAVRALQRGRRHPVRRSRVRRGAGTRQARGKTHSGGQAGGTRELQTAGDQRSDGAARQGRATGGAAKVGRPDDIRAGRRGDS